MEINNYIINKIQEAENLDFKNPEDLSSAIHSAILLSMFLAERTNTFNTGNVDEILPYLNYFQSIYVDKEEKNEKEYRKVFKEFMLKNVEIINKSDLKHENLTIKSRTRFENCLKIYLKFISKVLEDNVLNANQDICKIANNIVLDQETNNIEAHYKEHVENITIPRIKNESDKIRFYHRPNMSLLATTESEIEYDSSDYRFFMIGIEQYSNEKMLDLIESAKDGKVDLVDAITVIYQINNMIQAHCDNVKDRLFIKI